MVFLHCRIAVDEFPGAFEQLVLMALIRLGENAYGMTVRRELAAGTGRDVSLGAVYSTLDRLERKGWVSSRSVAAGDSVERGGRARRFFRVEAAGEAAVQRALAAMDRMRMPAPPDAVRRPRRPGIAGAGT